MERRLPRITGMKSDVDRREATSRSDGTSLALGSSEYRERVADLKGMDEFEKEAQDLDDAGLRRSKDFNEVDEQASDYRMMTGSLASDLNDDFTARNRGMLTTGQRNVSHEIRKGLLAEKALKDARQAAAETEDKEDDKFVKRRLPKQLDKAVYDAGKSEDDIYPGMATIEKYL